MKSLKFLSKIFALFFLSCDTTEEKKEKERIKTEFN